MLGLTDSPGQTALDRGGGIIQIIAIQAQTRLETERVTGTETRHLDIRVSEELFGDLDNVGRGHRQLQGRRKMGGQS